MYRTVSEEFEASVRTMDRQNGFEQFTQMAVDFFQCDPEALLIKCHRSYIEQEVKTADGSLMRRVYGMDFGAVIREEVSE